MRLFEETALLPVHDAADAAGPCLRLDARDTPHLERRVEKHGDDRNDREDDDEREVKLQTRGNAARGAPPRLSDRGPEGSLHSSPFARRPAPRMDSKPLPQ